MKKLALLRVPLIASRRGWRGRPLAGRLQAQDLSGCGLPAEIQHVERAVDGVFASGSVRIRWDGVGLSGALEQRAPVRRTFVLNPIAHHRAFIEHAACARQLRGVFTPVARGTVEPYPVSLARDVRPIRVQTHGPITLKS
jgi:hypothetical protein